MSYRSRRNVVYLVTVPETFKPQRPWDLPDTIATAELFAKNIPLIHAQHFCRVFNKRQMQTGLSDRRWALTVKHIRVRQ